MKKITVIALLLAAALGAQARNGSGKPAYKDAGRPVEERVSDLLSRMTLEEKVMQLNQYTLGRNDNANNVADPVDKIPAEIGSLIYFDTSPGLRNRLQKKAIEQSRLGIPVLFGYDVIHGFRTTYPISLAQACSWNPALVKQAAEVAAQEARMSGVEWTFSPMIDVARDGRWGRVSEGYGEDPYANAVYGVAAVEGYQGDNLADSRRVAACLKHFVGYGASEAGRDYVYTEISRQTLWDTYMPPYQAGIEAGAATVMSCFNDISGTPGTANPYILTEVLKERWAHDGFVVSDWAAIEQLRSQGVAADRKEAAEKAFNAGVEMDMMNRCYDAHLAALVREGKVSQEKLDEAVRRVLRLKFRLGLFERPYTPESEETDRFLLPASLAVAERLAEDDHGDEQAGGEFRGGHDSGEARRQVRRAHAEEQDRTEHAKEAGDDGKGQDALGEDARDDVVRAHCERHDHGARAYDDATLLGRAGGLDLAGEGDKEGAGHGRPQRAEQGHGVVPGDAGLVDAAGEHRSEDDDQGGGHLEEPRRPARHDGLPHEPQPRELEEERERHRGGQHAHGVAVED